MQHSTDEKKDFATIYDIFWHNNEFAITGRVYMDNEGEKAVDPNLYIVPCPLKLSEAPAKKKSANDAFKFPPLLLNCNEAAFATGIQDGHIA
jgi:hypothetical protein